MQKDLVLKMAELLCSNDIADGRAKYWVEKAARLFPGNPAAYRLKVNSILCSVPRRNFSFFQRWESHVHNNTQEVKMT